FNNQEWFTHHFPGDFIVEYIGQTRGWFYTLHILATALFDRPAFRTCVSHGIVLGDDGRKASKSLRNYPDPGEMWDTYGSDAVRLTLMSSPVLRGGNLIVAEESIREQVRGVLLPLWNTYYFFTLYANSVGGGGEQGPRGYEAQMVEPGEVSSLPVMDRYILARTRDLAQGVRADMENYDVPAAAARVREHMDVLTNWYVRTSRNRFWEEDTAAFNTLYTALEVLCRVAAPLAPMVTEEVWRGLTGQRSVHLSDWPTLGSQYANDPLVAAMDAVREVVSAAHGLRKAHHMRVRQPLRKLRVAVDNPQAMEPFTSLIAEEVNLLDVELLDLADVSATDYGVHDKLTVNAQVAGPRLGRDVQTAIQAARKGEWEQADGVVTSGGIRLEEGEYTIATEVDDSLGDDVAATTLASGFIVLDLALDDELLGAGYARDVVRQVQDARREADLVITDRIQLKVSVPADKVGWVETNAEFIASETLATSLEVHPGSGEDVSVEFTVA
ncbi:MAG TPA: class I tRNA ligase family protein, partial [Beutenbergiaceae bacterium]|nr:class I tRNA ligase family protein [Beutenbergiaceae bacterium]